MFHKHAWEMAFGSCFPSASATALPPLRGGLGWGRPRSGLSSNEMRKDGVDHSVGIGIDLRIRESENFEAPRRQGGIADLIPPQVSTVSVLSAVDLDDEPGFEACEIDDELPDRHLSAEMKTLRTQGAKAGPDLRFLSCHSLPEQARGHDFGRCFRAAPGRCMRVPA
jgi:hypothetical protein